MSRVFKNIIVVVKQTPYEHYSNMRTQGTAPVALRWERLKNRYESHRKCVDDLVDVLKKVGIGYKVVMRQDLHRGLLTNTDLIIAVGGDGTVLNSSSFVDDSIPVLGVNSDPTRPEERGVMSVKDERRSKGALCAATAANLDAVVPRILLGDIQPGRRARIQCLVRSTYTETRLPPALNDILFSHPIPAAVSRFRMFHCRGTVEPSYKPIIDRDEIMSFNCWSSGIWISTPTGSTAAMCTLSSYDIINTSFFTLLNNKLFRLAAGGTVMDPHSTDIQYMIREHLVEDNNSASSFRTHGFINPDCSLHMRWNSQNGCAFVDGSHFKHDLELGDEIRIDGHAPALLMFDQIKEEGSRSFPSPSSSTEAFTPHRY